MLNDKIWKIQECASEQAMKSKNRKQRGNVFVNDDGDNIRGHNKICKFKVRYDILLNTTSMLSG